MSPLKPNPDLLLVPCGTRQTTSMAPCIGLSAHTAAPFTSRPRFSIRHRVKYLQPPEALCGVSYPTTLSLFGVIPPPLVELLRVVVVVPF